MIRGIIIPKTEDMKVSLSPRETENVLTIDVIYYFKIICVRIDFNPAGPSIVVPGNIM